MNFDIFRGRLIVLEGEDHSGKTTIGKMMTDFLNDNEIETIFTFQPGDTQFGEHASITRDFCTKKTYDLNPLSNFFAFLLDRSENTAKIVMPALREGKAVIADRWWYSTIAYQFYGKELLKKFNLDIKLAREINFLASHFLKPDIALFFRREEEAVLKSKNDSRDLFESATIDFKQRVKEAYEIMIQGDTTFRVINVDENSSITLTRALTESHEHFLSM